MPQSSSTFSSSAPLHIAPGQSGASSAASSVVMPGVRPFPYDDNGLDPAAQSLSRLHEWVGALDRYLRLPNTFQAFSFYLVGLLLVSAGAVLHVWVAAQIMQAHYELASLERDYVAIEQENSELLFRLARDTNLNRMRERALALGYEPITEREYVVIPNEPLVDGTFAAPTTPQAVTAPVAAQTQADAADAAPLRQWQRLLRGEVVWEQPTSVDRNGDAGASQPAALRGEAAAVSSASPATDGGWQARWQQVVEQGKQLFTQIDLH